MKTLNFEQKKLYFFKIPHIFIFGSIVFEAKVKFFMSKLEIDLHKFW